MLEQSIILIQIIFIDIILAADNAIIIDAGKGTVTLDALITAEKRNLPIYRLDIQASLAGMIETQLIMDSKKPRIDLKRGSAKLIYHSKIPTKFGYMAHGYEKFI